ncbi:MAG: ATP-binding protein [Bacteroidota bacterium]
MLSVRNICVGLTLLLGVNTLYAQSSNKMTIEEHLVSAEKNIELGDLKEASRHFNDAAIQAWEAKNYPSAIEYFKRSIELNREIDNKSGIAKIQSNLGMIYSDMSDYKQSLSFFQKSLNYRAKFGEKSEVISTYINKAVVLNNLTQYEEAAYNLEEALRLATEMSDAAQMKSCYGMLAETYEKAGDQKKTIEYFNLYRTFHEMIQRNKLNAAKKETESERLKVLELELDKKDQEIALLNAAKKIEASEEALAKMDVEVRELVENNDKQELAIALLERELEVDQFKLAETQAKNEAQKIYTYIIIIFLIGALIIAFLLYRNYRFKKSTNKQLSEQNEEIKALNDNLELQVQQRTSELQKALTHLEKHNENLDQFSHVISHNLRGPVARILGLGSILDFGKPKSTDNLEVMQRLVGATKDLDAVVKDLSMILEINDHSNIPVSKLDIIESIQNVERLLKEEIKESEIQISRDIDKNEVYSVKSYLESILYNLLSNAIKYMQKDRPPKVQISVKQNGKYTKIAVKDNGVGIEESNYAKVFEPYNRLSNTGSGKGLGLYLVKTQTEAMAGRIQIESILGEGTTFTVELPKNPQN